MGIAGLLGHGRRGGGGGQARRRAVGDLAVEALGLGLGFHVEFALQHLAARLVLADREPALARRGVGAHQGAVAGLLKRIQRQQPPGVFDRPIPGGRGGAVVEQMDQRANDQRPQPAALARQPLIERRIANAVRLQQVAPVERGGALEPRVPAVAEAAFEV